MGPLSFPRIYNSYSPARQVILCTAFKGFVRTFCERVKQKRTLLVRRRPVEHPLGAPVTSIELGLRSK